MTQNGAMSKCSTTAPLFNLSPPAHESTIAHWHWQELALAEFAKLSSRATVRSSTKAHSAVAKVPCKDGSSAGSGPTSPRGT
mmetsp:Transcript_63655/g.113285  ORF Transcript_63655/g.113285 Transcript_63655/m.113285 type:complete len:82 (-) Transcript_63655:217-462(-)